ncbi:MAG TPA: zeta toxin family protein [Verrucomicrobiales bacterium]|nr:zeta toxin family protein [Verrucomicrobiales bacterium]
MAKTCFIVAGPNGAGKTTFAEAYLPKEAKCFNFINADLIAAGISPLRPEGAFLEAGRIFLRKMDVFVTEGATFGFESTLSGMGYLDRIRRMRANGYRIVIFYVKLPSPDLAVARVLGRVKEGGHNVPEEDIQRRFARSWSNFRDIYRPLADKWIVFDNSGEEPIILDKSDE